MPSDRKKLPTGKTTATLTPKQQRFVEEYLVDLNATQAAIRAGYSEKTARWQAAENLSKPNIQAAVAAGRKALTAEAGVTAARVVEEFAVIGFSDPDHYVVDDAGISLAPEAPRSAMRAVSSVKRRVRETTRGDLTERTVEVEYRFWDKNTALTQLGKHTGGFVERVELSGEIKFGLADKVRDARERIRLAR